MTADRKEYFRRYNAARAEARREYERERYRRKKAEGQAAQPARNCEECGGPIPAGRRADARYCSESCLKKAIRRRDPERVKGYTKKAHAKRRRQHADYMREYMRGYRARNKGVDRKQG